jgi:hypothetical protein
MPRSSVCVGAIGRWSGPGHRSHIDVRAQQRGQRCAVRTPNRPLIRCKDKRALPPIKRLRDRSRLTPTGSVTARVIDATNAVRLDCGGTRVGRYRRAPP